jgi:hypothetical protein
VTWNLKLKILYLLHMVRVCSSLNEACIDPSMLDAFNLYIFQKKTAYIYFIWCEFAVPSTIACIDPSMLDAFNLYIFQKKNSEHYACLKQDFENVNREVTPCSIASCHSPLYNSYTIHYQEFKCMRQ